MKDYYVFQHCKLDADEKVLRVAGERTRRIPVQEIAGLHLLAGYTLTSGVIDLASKNNIPIHVYNYYGTYRGTFFPPPVEATSSIIIAQLMSHTDEHRKVEIGRAILDASNKTASCLLSAFDIEHAPTINAPTVDELLLNEARIRKEYYALLDTLLPPFWSIVKRERKPPQRPADAVLGFANGIIYAKMAGWIHRSGLDPRIGYLHGEMRARNPLALDLAEIMKPVLSEGVLLEIAATGTERSIITEVGEGVYLNEKGRKTVIRLIEDVQRRSVKPSNIQRQDRVEMWGMSVPRKLHRALVEKDVPEFPVIPCTLSSHTMQNLEKERVFVPS